MRSANKNVSDTMDRSKDGKASCYLSPVIYIKNVCNNFN